MTFLKRILQYRIYRRLVISYLLLMIVTITLLCTILYTLFSSSAVKEIEQSSKEMLSQVSYTANVVYKQVQDITFQLLNDNQIMTFIYADEENKLINYNASLLLGKVNGLNPLIANISLYNFTNGAYVDTAGYEPDRKFAAAKQTQYIGLYPQEKVKEGKESLHVLTFKILPEQFAGIITSAIIVDLKESTIQNTMLSISASQKDANYFVVDSKGTVLSHSDTTRFMDNFSSQDYIQDILKGDKLQGSLVRSIDHKQMLITYVNSSALNWYFISVRPYDQLLSNIHQLRNMTLLFGFLLFIIGLTLSLLFSGNFYNPIKALVDKVNENGNAAKPPLLRFDEYELLSEAFSSSLESAKTMQNSLNRSTELLNNSYIFNVIKGNLDKGVIAYEVGREWLERLRGPQFAVLLFRIDGLRMLKERYNAFDRRLFRFAVSNIAQELLSKVFKVDIAIVEEEETVILIQTDQVSFDKDFYFLLAEIQDTINAYYKITVSISIGDLCDSVGDINGSYQCAQQYMKEKLFAGNGAILDATSVSRGKEMTTRYPSSNERKLIDSIKLCHKKSIQNEVSIWSGYLARSSHTQAIQYTNFLFHAIIREFESITEWWAMDPIEFNQVMDDIHYIETLDEMEQLLTSFCFRIVSLIEENKNDVAAAKNAKVIEEVKRFLHKQYADPSLSLELASDHVGLSAGYIGKLFKSITGSSFNDYVAIIRMEQAKTWLTTTNEAVAQIGEKVGIYNVSYFSTLFKKKYGMTPSQYREQPGP
ncbi:helix-turn-helix domain-containing protein [Paenibacillus psychroresistens]|uniref:Helix-turn-helix domain-containing protein n=1 Tax=Paenibacillus psychroresistens TaxID=1778678 RepID=A0A6B8RU74_9BACL|nr:helix-turn-helix domain-containing protein [Paenibacillus psychroresistens]QGQ99487.1 helix-turn-helix domain-containing protein [Paenibacillus psychroresistens]